MTYTTTPFRLKNLLLCWSQIEPSRCHHEQGLFHLKTPEALLVLSPGIALMDAYMIVFAVFEAARARGMCLEINVTSDGYNAIARHPEIIRLIWAEEFVRDNHPDSMAIALLQTYLEAIALILSSRN